MKTLLDRYLTIPRAPEGDGGGAPAANPDPAAGAPAAGAAAQPAAPGGTPAAPGAAPAAWKFEGLPETMYGKDDRETMDKMGKALVGYRQKLNEAQVPDDPKAYGVFEIDKIDENLRPHVAALQGDPVFDRVSVKAKEMGIPVATVQTLALELYGGYQAEGLLDVVDEEAEREALVPDAARHLPKDQKDAAIDARINANADFLNLMVKNGVGADGKPSAGGLPQEVADYAQAWLGDSAKGNQFLEWVARSVTGQGQAQPFAGQAGAGGGNSREALKAELAKPEMQHDHPKFNRAAYDDLMARYQAAIPDK